MSLEDVVKISDFKACVLPIKHLNLIFYYSNTGIVKLAIRVHFVSSVAGASEGL
jgi:hypothetical protein